MNINNKYIFIAFSLFMTLSIGLTTIIPEYENLLNICDLVEAENSEDDSEEKNEDDSINTYYNSNKTYASINKLAIINQFETRFYTSTGVLDIFSPPPENSLLLLSV